MTRIITTICLSVWMCLVGVAFAAQTEGAASEVAEKILAVEPVESVELSLDPEDELLRLLEEEAKAEAKKQQLQKVASEKQASETPVPVQPDTEPEAVEAKSIAAEAAPVTPVIAEPNKVESETESQKPDLTSELSDEGDDFHDLRKKLMLGQMEPVDEMTQEEQDDGLAQLIQQLRSLETPKKITPEKEAKPEPAVHAVSVESTDISASTQVQPSVETKAAQDLNEIRNDLLDRIEKSENIYDSLRLADVLYRQQYYQLALKYYQQTFETLSKEDAPNRQWVMFQMGNCARQIDEVKAIEIYSKLIAAYPNAKWTNIAMTRRSILQWSQNNEIQKLIVGAAQ